MCNRYNIAVEEAELAVLLGAKASTTVTWEKDVYPRYAAPVIREEAGKRIMDVMHWGFPMAVRGKTKILTKYVTNVRNLESTFWKGSVANPGQRCLVPFTRFAEPKAGKDADGKPAQYWFTVLDQTVACFAGLWRPTNEGAVFAFCTTEPNPLVAPLHPKAMPVILLAQDHNRWLHGSYAEAVALQAPYPSQMMSIL